MFAEPNFKRVVAQDERVGLSAIGLQGQAFAAQGQGRKIIDPGLAQLLSLDRELLEIKATAAQVQVIGDIKAVEATQE